MDFAWIGFAFVCGLGLKLVGLPPLIGFLIAGFALNAAGVQPNETLNGLADVGITLMLFTIGLKLNVRDLLKREVWAGTILNMVGWMVLASVLFVAAAALALPWFTDMSVATAALLALALSFSSTVCIIKILEESGETNSRHGKLAVGVLVMQDVVAVLFLVLATGEIPTLWALGLPLLLVARPLVGAILERAGHGEMLTLTGFLLALGGYELFHLVGVKGDLGALIVGTLIAAHPKAAELAKSLLGFKDLFLTAFFLSIGLTALPDAGMLLISLALCLLLPLKAALFFGLFAWLRLRVRTGFLAAMVLGNYSEFGLIVAYLCVSLGWMTGDWLVILALTVSMSFVVTSVLYRSAHVLYARGRDRLRVWESPERLPEDQVFRPSEAEILVVGTGRVGLGAFRALHAEVGDRVWGMDADRDRIAQQLEAGMHVFAGDAENADVWETVDVQSIRLVLLAVPSIEDCLNIRQQLGLAGYTGRIAAIARYEDERAELLAGGIDDVFDFFNVVGSAFAKDSLRLITPAPVPDEQLIAP